MIVFNIVIMIALPILLFAVGYELITMIMRAIDARKGDNND